MSDTAAVSALLSASAVVGALTTQHIITWYVDTTQLKEDVAGRTTAQQRDDDRTQQLKGRRSQLQSRQSALLLIAGIQWAVVAVLLTTAGCLSKPWGATPSDLTPFFMATLALLLALVVVPLGLTIAATKRLRWSSSKLHPAATNVSGN